MNIYISRQIKKIESSRRSIFFLFRSDILL